MFILGVSRSETCFCYLPAEACSKRWGPQILSAVKTVELSWEDHHVSPPAHSSGRVTPKNPARKYQVCVACVFVPKGEFDSCPHLYSPRAGVVAEDQIVYLNERFAVSLGIPAQQDHFDITPVFDHEVDTAKEVWLKPLQTLDSEILEAHGTWLEENFLGQVRLVCADPRNHVGVGTGAGDDYHVTGGGTSTAAGGGMIDGAVVDGRGRRADEGSTLRDIPTGIAGSLTAPQGPQADVIFSVKNVFLPVFVHGAVVRLEVQKVVGRRSEQFFRRPNVFRLALDETELIIETAKPREKLLDVGEDQEKTVRLQVVRSILSPQKAASPSSSAPQCCLCPRKIGLHPRIYEWFFESEDEDERYAREVARLLDLPRSPARGQQAGLGYGPHQWSQNALSSSADPAKRYLFLAPVNGEQWAPTTKLPRAFQPFVCHEVTRPYDCVLYGDVDLLPALSLLTARLKIEFPIIVPRIELRVLLDDPPMVRARGALLSKQLRGSRTAEDAGASPGGAAREINTSSSSDSSVSNMQGRLGIGNNSASDLGIMEDGEDDLDGGEDRENGGWWPSHVEQKLPARGVDQQLREERVKELAEQSLLDLLVSEIAVPAEDGAVFWLRAPLLDDSSASVPVGIGGALVSKIIDKSGDEDVAGVFSGGSDEDEELLLGDLYEEGRKSSRALSTSVVGTESDFEGVHAPTGDEFSPRRGVDDEEGGQGLGRGQEEAFAWLDFHEAWECDRKSLDESSTPRSTATAPGEDEFHQELPVAVLGTTGGETLTAARKFELIKVELRIHDLGFGAEEETAASDARPFTILRLEEMLRGQLAVTLEYVVAEDRRLSKQNNLFAHGEKVPKTFTDDAGVVHSCRALGPTCRILAELNRDSTSPRDDDLDGEFLSEIAATGAFRVPVVVFLARRGLSLDFLGSKDAQELLQQALEIREFPANLSQTQLSRQHNGHQHDEDHLLQSSNIADLPVFGTQLDVLRRNLVTQLDGCGTGLLLTGDRGSPKHELLGRALRDVLQNEGRTSIVFWMRSALLASPRKRFATVLQTLTSLFQLAISVGPTAVVLEEFDALVYGMDGSGEQAGAATAGEERSRVLREYLHDLLRALRAGGSGSQVREGMVASSGTISADVPSEGVHGPSLGTTATSLSGRSSSQFVLVATATQKDYAQASPGSLSSSGGLEQHINIAPPDLGARVRIIQWFLSREQTATTETIGNTSKSEAIARSFFNADLAKEIAARTDGYAVRDLERLVASARELFLSKAHDEPNHDGVRQLLNDRAVFVKELMDSFPGPASMQHKKFFESDVEWSDVGGLASVKQVRR